MRIELLSCPGCANVDSARRTLESCLADLGLVTAITELVGDYPSPTILVDSSDVMRDADCVSACCRLDLPTRDRVLAALTNGSLIGNAAPLNRSVDSASG